MQTFFLYLLYTEEMCVAVMFVTPPVPLQACAQTLDPKQLNALTNTSDIAIPSVNSTFDDIKAYVAEMTTRLKAIEWDQSNLALVQKLQDFYLYSP